MSTWKYTSLGFLLLVVGCSFRPHQEWSIRLKAPPSVSVGAQRSGPALNDFGCYFLTVGGTEGPSGLPSCLKLARPSRLVTYAALTGDGVQFRAPVGFRRRLTLYGASSGACSTGSQVAELFQEPVRPSLYELGHTEVDLLGPKDVEITPDYDATAATDLAACDESNTGSLVFTSLTPAFGLHRGGALVTVTGEGFIGGTLVDVGGSACTSVSVTSSTSLTCRAPKLTPGSHSATVRNPDGDEDSSAGVVYQARALVLVAHYASGQTTQFVKSFWLDPNSGELTLADQLSVGSFNESYVRMAVHPKGRSFYMTNSRGGFSSLSHWTVEPDTGIITKRLEYLGTSIGPRGMAISPEGAFLVAVPEAISSVVRVMRIDSVTGALTEESQGSPIDFGFPVTSEGVIFNRSGTRVFAVASPPLIPRTWRFEDGQLSIPDITNEAISGRFYVLDTRRDRLFAADANVERLWSAGYSSDGALSSLDNEDILSTPTGLAFHEGTDRIFYGTPTDVHSFGVNPGDGELTSLGSATVSTGFLKGVFVEPNGQYVIVGEGTGGASLRSFNLDGNGVVSSAVDTEAIPGGVQVMGLD